MTELQRLMRDFLRDDAGTPLGIGMPSGGPLRADGQSHYEAWQSLLRRDPCSYCGAAGASGTVDHVDPRSRGARGLGTVHGWVNTVGACTRCNGAKRDLGLLVFLYRRRWSGRTIVRPGGVVMAFSCSMHTQIRHHAGGGRGRSPVVASSSCMTTQNRHHDA